jgi:hypothetical protein
MKDCNGEELIALAGTLAIKVAKCMDIEELAAFTEFLGLFKHNLEIIKIRRFLKKVEKKIEEKKG